MHIETTDEHKAEKIYLKGKLTVICFLFKSCILVFLTPSVKPSVGDPSFNTHISDQNPERPLAETYICIIFIMNFIMNPILY